MNLNRINFKEMIDSLSESMEYRDIDETLGFILEFLNIDSKVECIEQEFNLLNNYSSLATLKKRFGYTEQTNAYFIQESESHFKKYIQDYKSCQSNIDKVEYLINNYFFRFWSDTIFQIIKFSLNKEMGIEFVLAKNFAYLELLEKSNRKDKLLAEYVFAKELISRFFLFQLIHKCYAKTSNQDIDTDLRGRYIYKKDLISITGMNKETFRKIFLKSGLDVGIIKGNISRKDFYSVLHFFLEGEKDLSSSLTMFNSLKNFYTVNYYYSELLKTLGYNDVSALGLTNKKKDLIQFLNLVSCNANKVFYYDKIYQYGIPDEEYSKYKNSDIVEFWFFKKVIFNVLNVTTWEEVFLKTKPLSNS